MRTLSITNGILSSISDLVAQGIEGSTAKSTGKSDWRYDPVRTLRFAAFGTAMGPVIGKWLQFLDYKFPLSATAGALANQAPSKAKQGVQLAKRVLADQVVAAPVGLALFTGLMSGLEGKSLGETQDKFRTMYPRALLTNWQVWPVIQAVNFTIVPLQFRLPFQQTAGILWTCYLSMLNKKNDVEEAQRAKMPGGTRPSAKEDENAPTYTFETQDHKDGVYQDRDRVKTR